MNDLENLLRETLADGRRSLPAGIDALDRVTRRARTIRRRRQAVAAALSAVVLAGAGTTAALVATDGQHSPDAVLATPTASGAPRSPEPTVSPTPSASAGTAASVPGSVVLAGRPLAMTLAPDAVYLLEQGGGVLLLERVDRATMKITISHKIEGVAAGSLYVRGADLYVATATRSGGLLQRLDATSLAPRARRDLAAAPGGVVTRADGVWLATSGALLHLSGSDLKQLGSTALPAAGDPARVATDPRSPWVYLVLNPSAGSAATQLLAVDTATGKVTATRDLPGPGGGVPLATRDAVWAAYPTGMASTHQGFTMPGLQPMPPGAVPQGSALPNSAAYTISATRIWAGYIDGALCFSAATGDYLGAQPAGPGSVAAIVADSAAVYTATVPARGHASLRMRAPEGACAG